MLHALVIHCQELETESRQFIRWLGAVIPRSWRKKLGLTVEIREDERREAFQKIDDFGGFPKVLEGLKELDGEIEKLKATISKEVLKRDYRTYPS